MTLKYNNDGRIIDHVPPRDLNDNDIEALVTHKRLFDSVEQAIADLTKRGIYSVPRKPRTTKDETIVTEDES